MLNDEFGDHMHSLPSVEQEKVVMDSVLPEKNQKKIVQDSTNNPKNRECRFIEEKEEVEKKGTEF